MFGTFPYEPEPDGAVFGPHHFYLGVLLILLVYWMVYDADTESKPWVVAGMTLLSVFAFSLTWPYYPAIGAVGVLVLLGVATASALLRPFWWRSSLLAQSSLLVGLFVAWDDALSHALGWRTPLDALWIEYLYPYVSNPRVPPTPQLPRDLSDVRVPSDVQLPTDVRLPSDLRFPSDVRLPTDLRLSTDATLFGDLLADLEALLAEHVPDALAVVAL